MSIRICCYYYAFAVVASVSGFFILTYFLNAVFFILFCISDLLHVLERHFYSSWVSDKLKLGLFTRPDNNGFLWMWQNCLGQLNQLCVCVCYMSILSSPTGLVQTAFVFMLFFLFLIPFVFNCYSLPTLSTFPHAQSKEIYIHRCTVDEVSGVQFCYWIIYYYAHIGWPLSYLQRDHCTVGVGLECHSQRKFIK